MVHPTCHEGGRGQQSSILGSQHYCVQICRYTDICTHMLVLLKENNQVCFQLNKGLHQVHHGTLFCPEQVFDMQTLRLRGILEWRDEVTSGPDHSGSSTSSEVMILIWPAGEFKRLPRGTTASEIVHDQVR